MRSAKGKNSLYTGIHTCKQSMYSTSAKPYMEMSGFGYMEIDIVST